MRGWALDFVAAVRCAASSACTCWPGCAPGSAPPFLVRTRKGGKRKRPHVCDPCASLRGKPAPQRLRGARWNSLRSLRSLRSNNPREPDHEARASCGARATPQAPRRRRSDGPCWGSTPLWPCREAQGLGRTHAPQDACAWWSGLLRLSARSERSERSEFRSTAPGASIAACPQRSEGTRPVGSPFFGSFLWRSKERDCAAGRTSRPAAACRVSSTSNHSEPIQRRSPSPQPSPQRGEGARHAHIQRRRPLTPALSPNGRGSKAPGQPARTAAVANSTSLISMVNKIRTS